MESRTDSKNQIILNRFWGILLWLLVLIVQGSTAAESEITSYFETLPSGLRTVVIEDPNSHLAHVSMTYAAGSYFEPDSLAGIAHLTEHLSFESSRLMSRKEMKRRRTLFAINANASTSPFVMTFHLKCIPGFLPELLEVEAARFSGLELTEYDFAKEKKIVLQELSFRYHGSAGKNASSRIRELSYGNQNLGRKIGGSADTVDRITLDAVREFTEEYLQPGNAVLVVKGPQKSSEVMDIIRMAFAEIPEGPPGQAPSITQLPRAESCQLIEDDPDIEGMKLLLGFRAPISNLHEQVIARTLEEWLPISAGYISARMLGSELFVIVNSVTKYFPIPMHLQGGGEIDPDQNVADFKQWIWKSIYEELSELSYRKSFELRRQEIRELWQRRTSLHESARNVASATLFNQHLVSHLEADSILSTIPPETVLAFLNKYINNSNVVELVIHGNDSGRLSPIDITKRVQRDTLAAHDEIEPELTEHEINDVLTKYVSAIPLSIPRFELSNGIPVYIFKSTGYDEVSILMYHQIPYHKQDRVGKQRGIATLYNRIVNKGHTSTTQQNGVVEDFESPFGLSLKLRPGLLSVTANSDENEIDDMAKAISFRLYDDEFNIGLWQMSLRYTDALNRMSGNTASRRNTRWLLERLLGLEHPQLANLAPVTNLGQKVDYGHIKKLHRRVTSGKGTWSIAVTGNFDTETVIAILEKHFSSLSHKPHSREYHAPTPQSDTQGKIVSDFQARDIRIQLAFPPVAEQSFGASEIMLGEVLKTAVNNRVNKILRHDAGLSYTTNVDFYYCGGSRSPYICVTTQPEESIRSFNMLKEEVSQLYASGFTNLEIEKAKFQILGRYMQWFDNRLYALSWLMNALRYESVPSDPIAALIELESEDINTWFKSLFPPQDFVYTIVGPLFDEDIDQYESGS